MMCRSVRHSPAPPTLTITSYGPLASGSATSSTTGRSSYRCNRTAFITPPVRTRTNVSVVLRQHRRQASPRRPHQGHRTLPGAGGRAENRRGGGGGKGGGKGGGPP